MSREPNPLKATRAEDIEAREAELTSRFATARLNFLVGVLGLQRARRRAYELGYEQTGRHVFTFDLLLRVLPQFPVYLGFDRLGPLHEMQSATLPALFNKFESSPIAKAYQRFREANPEADDRVVGLVFPRNRIVQGLIVHNGSPDVYCVAGTSLVTSGPRMGTLVVQKFAAFVSVLYSERHAWLNE